VILRVVDREQIATKATVRSKYGAEGNTSFVFKTVRRRYDVIGSMIRQVPILRTADVDNDGIS
jgi:hypothetical protein